MSKRRKVIIALMAFLRVIFSLCLFLRYRQPKKPYFTEFSDYRVSFNETDFTIDWLV